MNILYVTPYVPSHIRTRPFNLIRALLRLGHRVDLLTASGTSLEEQEQADRLRDWGMQVEVFQVPLLRSLRNCLGALPTGEPFQAAYSYNPVIRQRLGARSQDEVFDVVHIEHLRASRLITAAEDTPVVYDSVDSISLLFEQAAKASPQWRSRLMTVLDLSRTRRYEAQLLTRCDRVVVTSQRDKEALQALGDKYLQAEEWKAPIRVIRNGVDLEYFGGPESGTQRDNKTVVFTGKMSYHANVAAVLYFSRQVLPHIWSVDPSVQFEIVGKDPPEEVRRLATDRRIRVTGTVEDLRPYLARAAVAVCPALYAVGIQNKVLEAMAMGTPVVSTPDGCAALTVEEDQQILVARGEMELASAVLRILTDPALGERLSASGRRYVESNHSWDSGALQLIEVYQQAGSSSHGRI
jgi:sugar transferase (PEP-CTERM/EpsH1 system associated)